MTRTKRAFAWLGATLVVATAPAWASGGGEGEAGHGGDFVWQSVNLLILLAVLVWAARKPVQTFFAERRKRIGSDLEEAGALLAEAEQRYAEWQRKLIDLDRDLETIRTEGRRRAEDERDAILAEAQLAAERIHRNAIASVEQELRRARAALREEAALLATEMAERILRERLEDADRDRLLDEFITRVEPNGSASAR